MKSFGRSIGILCHFLPLVALFCVSSSNAAVPTPAKPLMVSMEPQNVFVPHGFDDNDNSQVVVSGYLPNTCYKAGPISAEVSEKTRTIKIKNMAYFYPQMMCLEMVVPYVQTFNLGLLSSGDYQVVTVGEADEIHSKGSLPIALSTKNTPDDYLYAPVRDVFLDSYDGGQKATLAIQGTFSSGCMKLEEVRVRYQEPNIVEVLPIASLLDKENCLPAGQTFTTKTVLTIPWTGTTLIYVRSLNGQAISKIVNG